MIVHILGFAAHLILFIYFCMLHCFFQKICSHSLYVTGKGKVIGYCLVLLHGSRLSGKKEREAWIKQNKTHIENMSFSAENIQV